VAEVKVAAAAAGDDDDDDDDDSSDDEGVAAAVGGGYDGRRLVPLNYTEQWIIEIKEWLAEFEKERLRVIPMPNKFGGGQEV